METLSYLLKVPCNQAYAMVGFESSPLTHVRYGILDRNQMRMLQQKKKHYKKYTSHFEKYTPLKDNRLYITNILTELNDEPALSGSFLDTIGQGPMMREEIERMTSQVLHLFSDPPVQIITDPETGAKYQLRNRYIYINGKIAFWDPSPDRNMPIRYTIEAREFEEQGQERIRQIALARLAQQKKIIAERQEAIRRKQEEERKRIEEEQKEQKRQEDEFWNIQNQQAYQNYLEARKNKKAVVHAANQQITDEQRRIHASKAPQNRQYQPTAQSSDLPSNILMGPSTNVRAQPAPTVQTFDINAYQVNYQQEIIEYLVKLYEQAIAWRIGNPGNGAVNSYATHAYNDLLVNYSQWRANLFTHMNQFGYGRRYLVFIQNVLQIQQNQVDRNINIYGALRELENVLREGMNRGALNLHLLNRSAYVNAIVSNYFPFTRSSLPTNYPSDTLEPFPEGVGEGPRWLGSEINQEIREQKQAEELQRQAQVLNEGLITGNEEWYEQEFRGQQEAPRYDPEQDFFDPDMVENEEEKVEVVPGPPPPLEEIPNVPITNRLPFMEPAAHGEESITDRRDLLAEAKQLQLQPPIQPTLNAQDFLLGITDSQLWIRRLTFQRLFGRKVGPGYSGSTIILNSRRFSFAFPRLELDEVLINNQMDDENETRLDADPRPVFEPLALSAQPLIELLMFDENRRTYPNGPRDRFYQIRIGWLMRSDLPMFGMPQEPQIQLPEVVPNVPDVDGDIEMKDAIPFPPMSLSEEAPEIKEDESKIEVEAKSEIDAQGNEITQIQRVIQPVIQQPYYYPGGPQVNPSNLNWISTPKKPTYLEALTDALRLIEEIWIKYEEDAFIIAQWQVWVYYLDNAHLLVGQAENALSRQVQKKMHDLHTYFFVVSPTSKINCLWTAVAIGLQFEKTERKKQELKEEYRKEPIILHEKRIEDCEADEFKLLNNHKYQNSLGCQLKKKIGPTYANFGCGTDLQNIADYENVSIHLYNFSGERYLVYNPQDEQEKSISIDDGDNPVEYIHSSKVPVINLMLSCQHYYCLIFRYNISTYTMEHLGKTEKKVLDHNEPFYYKRIPKRESETQLKRVVVYDIETYKKPMGPLECPEIEVNQIAYAIGWCFILDGEIEEKYCESHNYKIIPVKLQDKDIFIGYQFKLGNGCLDAAMNEWLHESIFHNSCFYAHNGGKFDLRIILGQSKLRYEPSYRIDPKKLIELNGRFLNMTVYNDEITYEIHTGKFFKKKNGQKGKERVKKQVHTIHLKDSLAVFGMGNSLKSLCDEFNVPHKKLEEKIVVHELQYEETWRENWDKYELAKYLENDCMGLLEVLILFENDCFGATTIHLTDFNTSASLAKKHFLTNLYNDSLDATCIYTLPYKEDVFIRAAFNGGRVENFVSKFIEEKIYYYDFTSLYPDVARNMLPVGKPKYIADPHYFTDGNEEIARRLIQTIFRSRVYEGNTYNRKVFWKVLVRSPKAAQGNPERKYKPLFGVKNSKTKGMFLFCWFKDWTEMTLYEEEIIYAVRNKLDYEFEPIQGIQFEQAPILKEAMEKIFALKAQANREDKPSLEKLWKLIANSLFGVWGLKKFNRRKLEIAKPHESNWPVDLVQGKLIDIQIVGEYVVTVKEGDLDVPETNVALAAAITSEARLKLYRCMKDIIDKGGEILYCDTDSIITTYCLENDQELNAKWIGQSQGKDLGTLKNEIDSCYKKLNRKLIAKGLEPRSPKKYFDKGVIVAPKFYIVTAEEAETKEGTEPLIVKKANKGYKENYEKGDIVTYERMKILVDDDIPEKARLIKQRTIHWAGSNVDILKNPNCIGVRHVLREKVIQSKAPNKGTLNNLRQVEAFTNIPMVQQESEELDERLDDLIRCFTPESTEPKPDYYFD